MKGNCFHGLPGELFAEYFMERKFRLLRRLAVIYSERQIPRASAALSYYLTMTVFPLIICLYTLLGRNFQKTEELLEMASRFIAADTVRFIRDFLGHVSQSNSHAMMAAGLAVLISSSSAAIRTIQATIGEMQGGKRYEGLVYFLFSIVFSLLFLAAMYFSVLVIVTGREVLALINGILPFVDVSGAWDWLRFLLLAGIILVIFWGVYLGSKRRSDHYRCFPGAAIATVATVLMSAAFSEFIGQSAKYPLVYGSLASLILLMLWLHICCQIIYTGAAFNIALRDIKTETETEEEKTGEA